MFIRRFFYGLSQLYPEGNRESTVQKKVAVL